VASVTFAAGLVDRVPSGPDSLVNGCSDLEDVSLVIEDDGSSIVDDLKGDLIVSEERVWAPDTAAWTSVEGCNDVSVVELVVMPELVGDSARLPCDRFGGSEGWPELERDCCDPKDLTLLETWLEPIDVLLICRVEVCRSVVFLKCSSDVELLPYAKATTAALETIVLSFIAEKESKTACAG
jgi:hypothetical protein